MELSQRTVLVTCGAGFIRSQLVGRLVEEGLEETIEWYRADRNQSDVHRNVKELFHEQ